VATLRHKRLVRWVRDVVTEQQVGSPIPVDLERPAGAKRHVFRLGVRAGFGGQETARLPIEKRPNTNPHPVLKEVHACEVAGRRLEAANVWALREKVRVLLETLAPAHALPLCYFRAPAQDYELPVYEEDGGIVSPVLAGPKLRARDLGEMRTAVCRYLVSAGYVTSPDEVEVGVVRPRDLKLVDPAAIFRSLDDRDFWVPSVEGVSPEGPVVGLLGRPAALSPRRTRVPRRPGPHGPDDAPAAPDVLALLRYVRSELERHGAAAGEHANPGSVYAAEVRADIWADGSEKAEDTGRRLVAYLTDDDQTRLELRVLRTGAGDMAAALEHDGIDVFLGPDENALAAAVGRYLQAQDFLRFKEEVEIHAVSPPRPEWLDADTIFGNGAGAGPDTEHKEALSA
jgi:hypothetical protein